MTVQLRARYPASLVLPLDGSRASDIAAPFAAEIAARASVAIRVVHVFGSVKELSAAATGEITWNESAEPRSSVRPIPSIAESVELLKRSGATVEVIGLVGNPSEEIRKEAERVTDSWIVMSGLGSSGFRSMLLGSTAKSVVRSSTCPVLLVPSSESVRRIDSTSPTNRLAVFLDGTPVAEQAVCEAAGAARTLGVELDLVRVATTYRDDDGPGSHDDAKWEEPALEAVRGYLRNVAVACREQQLVVREIALAGSPGVQLHEYVRSNDPLIVVLATRKRSGIERWTYGSLAERLVDTLPVPLLLVPVAET